VKANNSSGEEEEGVSAACIIGSAPAASMKQHILACSWRATLINIHRACLTGALALPDGLPPQHIIQTPLLQAGSNRLIDSAT